MMRSFGLLLLSQLIWSTSVASAAEEAPYFRVRALHHSATPVHSNIQNQPNAGRAAPQPSAILVDAEARHEQLRRDMMEVTFSADGTPIVLELIRLQLFPTSGELSNNARVILGSAWGGYLRDELERKWEKDDSFADLTDVDVQIMGILPIESKVDRQGSLGTEATIETTLKFDGLDSPPSDDVVRKAVEEAMKKLDKFLSDYLVSSGLPDFADVDAAFAKWDADSGGFKPTDPPQDAPAAAPTSGNGGEDDDEDDRNVAGANDQLNPDNDEPGNLRVLIPASIAGLVVFVLTAFFIAQRRRNASDLNDSYDSNGDRFADDVDVNTGSTIGKDEIEVSPGNLGMDTAGDYGGRTAMHIPAQDYTPSPIRITGSPDMNHPNQYYSDQRQEGQYVRRMLNNNYEDDSEDTSEY
eukprot:scaffold22607_cov123-Cylindrotheca_fusiformis.AAC.26